MTSSACPRPIFVIDTKKEAIGVVEANKLGVPIVAVVDTNCDPDVIQYVIPGNDDAIRAGNLMCRIISDAVEEGRFIRSRVRQRCRAGTAQRRGRAPGRGPAGRGPPARRRSRLPNGRPASPRSRPRARRPRPTQPGAAGDGAPDAAVADAAPVDAAVEAEQA